MGRTRVFIPATFDTLASLAETDVVPVRGRWAFSVTDELTKFYEGSDEEEVSHVAFQEAALASLRLLAAGPERFPSRRVVITAEVDDAYVTPAPSMGDAVVQLSEHVVDFADVTAFHVDISGSEEATAKAVAVIDAADLGDEDAELTVGDALDNFLAWYDPLELPLLIAMSTPAED